MNEQNLIPVTKRSKKEARELSRRGGIASGKARRDKRTLRQIALELLPLLAVDEDKKPMKSPFTGNEMSVGEMLATAQIEQAAKGDSKAFKVLCDLLGETIFKAELTGKDGAALIPPQQMSDADIAAEIERINASLNK